MTHPEPDPSSGDGPYAREIRDLVEEIKKQNVLLRRYLFVFAAALALLLLLQFDSLRELFGLTLQIALVVVVLLTAPIWSKGIVYLTSRIPWLSKKDEEKSADA